MATLMPLRPPGTPAIAAIAPIGAIQKTPMEQPVIPGLPAPVASDGDPQNLGIVQQAQLGASIPQYPTMPGADPMALAPQTPSSPTPMFDSQELARQRMNQPQPNTPLRRPKNGAM